MHSTASHSQPLERNERNHIWTLHFNPQMDKSSNMQMPSTSPERILDATWCNMNSTNRTRGMAPYGTSLSQISQASARSRTFRILEIRSYQFDRTTIASSDSVSIPLFQGLLRKLNISCTFFTSDSLGFGALQGSSPSRIWATCHLQYLPYLKYSHITIHTYDIPLLV